MMKYRTKDGDLIGTDENGNKVMITMTDDCDENIGGFFCMIHYWDEENNWFHDDYGGYFCIHPEDCDCKDDDAVDACALKKVKNGWY